jgi:hypothetical protein
MISRIWPWLLGAICIAYLGSLALSQTVHDPNPVAAACAYSTSPPTLTSGTFGYVQCDSTGKLRIH